jgi:hypothetical protein
MIVTLVGIIADFSDVHPEKAAAPRDDRVKVSIQTINDSNDDSILSSSNKDDVV